jgi:hypothetical protein
VNSPFAIRLGQKLARIVFNKRGNHSEAHISEAELASIIQVGVEAALNGSVNIIIENMSERGA